MKISPYFPDTCDHSLDVQEEEHPDGQPAPAARPGRGWWWDGLGPAAGTRGFGVCTEPWGLAACLMRVFWGDTHPCSFTHCVSSLERRNSPGCELTASTGWAMIDRMLGLHRGCIGAVWLSPVLGSTPGTWVCPVAGTREAQPGAR